MNLKEKIALYLNFSGLSQEEFAANCGWEQGRLNHYMHGRRQLKLPAIETLAKSMGVDPAWIAFDRNPPPWANLKTNIFIKITSWSDLKSIDPEYLKEPFVLTITDHTMEDHTQPRRSFYEGQQIEIHPNEPLRNGVFVVALLKDSKEPVFRRYSDVAGRKQLETFSDKYPAIPMEQVDRIIGVVKMRFEEVSI